VRRSVVVSVMLASALCGCGGDRELRCEPSDRYQSAASVPPVRVPDDLSVPDESNALRLPPPPADPGTAPTVAGCPENPPPFFEDRRLGDPEVAPASEREPDPADDPERQIGN
jgi:uncharacterized lipoprotein